MFLTPAAAKHYKPQNTQRNKVGENKRPAANPQTRNFRRCGRANLAFLRALQLAPESTKCQPKKTHVHSGIRTRNRQYAYMLVPRPLPPPSMLVLAGQNRKWALSVLFVHKRFAPPNNYFRLSPLCSEALLISYQNYAHGSPPPLLNRPYCCCCCCTHPTETSKYPTETSKLLRFLPISQK